MHTYTHTATNEFATFEELKKSKTLANGAKIASPVTVSFSINKTKKINKRKNTQKLSFPSMNDLSLGIRLCFFMIPIRTGYTEETNRSLFIYTLYGPETVQFKFTGRKLKSFFFIFNRLSYFISLPLIIEHIKYFQLNLIFLLLITS